jgi:hypothetical protein
MGRGGAEAPPRFFLDPALFRGAAVLVGSLSVPAIRVTGDSISMEAVFSRPASSPYPSNGPHDHAPITDGGPPMYRCLRPIVLASFATLTLAGGAHAAGNFNAKIMLHALSPTTKNVCTRSANAPTLCSAYDAGIDNLALYPAVYFTYLLVTNASQAEGVAGVQCGISYDPMLGAGVDVYTWTLCATLEFSSTGWPQSGGGNLITWDATTRCQTTAPSVQLGVVAVAGYFYLAAYSPDLMRVTRRPVDNAAKVANCGSVEDDVDWCFPGQDFATHLGAAGFGRGGINPCGRSCPDPVESSTWSGVKALTHD